MSLSVVKTPALVMLAIVVAPYLKIKLPPDSSMVKFVVSNLGVLAAVPVVFWFSVGTSAAASARNVGVPEEPFGAAKIVLAVWEAKLEGVTASVPPRVKLPVLVTVPVRLIPLTVPVPLTDVTVPVPGAEAEIV